MKFFKPIVAVASLAALCVGAMPAKAGLNDAILEFCASVVYLNATQNMSGRPGTPMARHAASSSGQSNDTYRKAWNVAKSTDNYMCKKMY